MSRACVIVLDAVGAGELPDAAEFGDDTIGNPAPVVDRRSGDVVLLLTRNPGKITEKQIVEESRAWVDAALAALQ